MKQSPSSRMVPIKLPMASSSSWRMRYRWLPVLAILAAMSRGDVALADPFDFLKRLGNSIAHPHREQAQPRPTRRPVRTSGGKSRKADPGTQTSEEITPEPQSSVMETPAPTPTETPIMTRAAVAAPAGAVITNGKRRDLPYGIPVPNRPGFVMSPYAPTGGFVDVREFQSGTEVKDPYTGKVFLTP